MKKLPRILLPLLFSVYLLCGVLSPVKCQTSGILENGEFQYRSGAVIRGDQTEKKLALVFTGDLYAESGPSIAAFLQQNHIRASFFLTGNFYRNSSFEPLIHSLIAGGNYLGAHSDRHLLYCDWNHRDSLLVTREQFELDLEQNYREMEHFGIEKEEARYFLPPYEWYNDTISSWTRNLGLQLINYTPGTLSHADYTVPGTPGYRSSEEILRSILKEEQCSPQGLNGYMLLMHVGSDEARKDKFYPFLKILVDILLSKGYRFVRVDELLELPGRSTLATGSPGRGWAGNGNLVINRYDPHSGIWERLHDVLIDGEGERNAYWQACTDNQGNLHLSWVWRESRDVATNHDLGYAVSPDAGESWFTSDGNPYTLPITAGSAEYAARIPQQRELINQTSMAADDEGRPCIATYFTPSGSEVPQYHLIFRNAEGWKIHQITHRTTPLTISGGGTRKIPISRPKVLINQISNQTRALLVYRDAATGSRITLGYGDPDHPEEWEFRQLLPSSVDSWEPTCDTELWRTQGHLHLFIQRVGQGEGEQLEELPPQDVHILEVPLPVGVNRSPSDCGN